MVELNEKALEAAHHTYQTHEQIGDLKAQRLSDSCLTAVITAYLSALPAPDGLVDPDAYVDWESQCVWRAENIKDPSGLQPVWFAPALQSQAKQIVLLTQERDEALDRHSSAVMGEVEATLRAEAAEQQVQKLTAENERLREALNLIDALDPEEHIYGVSHDACRGLIIRMGQVARSALETQESGNSQ